MRQDWHLRGGRAALLWSAAAADAQIRFQLLADGYGQSRHGAAGARVPEQFSAFASTGSVSIVFAQAIGKTLLYASRGGIDVGEIILSGVPVLNQVRWDIATGTLTVAATVPFVTGEYVKIIVY